MVASEQGRRGNPLGSIPVVMALILLLSGVLGNVASGAPSAGSRGANTSFEKQGGPAPGAIDATSIVPSIGDLRNQQGFIRVAGDGWHFEDESGTPFVPFGTTYTPSWAGWSPNYFDDRYYNESKFDGDFAILSSLGANVIRVVVPYDDLLPPLTDQVKCCVNDPPVNATTLTKVATVIQLAKAHGLRVILTSGWPGARTDHFPPLWGVPPGANFWFYGGNFWFGMHKYTYNVSRLTELDAPTLLKNTWRKIAERFLNEPTVMAYVPDVEIGLLWFWKYPTYPGRWTDDEPQAMWNLFLELKYGTTAALNAAWGTGYAGFGRIDIPMSTPVENDTKLYDFQLFREWVLARFLRIIVDGIRMVDTRHLVGVDLRPEITLLRWPGPDPDTGVNDGLFGVPPSFQELAKVVDFLAVHSYQYLWGVPIDQDSQLKIMRMMARHAYNRDYPKPVIIGEYGYPPESYNAQWSKELVYATRHDVAGWLAWAYEDNPKGDWASQEMGLIRDRWHLLPENYSFEQGIGGWLGWQSQISQSSDYYPTQAFGTKSLSLQVSASMGAAYTANVTPVEPNSDYEISVLYHASGDPRIALEITQFNADGSMLKRDTAWEQSKDNSNWWAYGFVFHTLSDAAQVRIAFLSTTGQVNIDFANILRLSPQTSGPVLTPWGSEFQQLAPTFTTTRFDRSIPDRVVRLDKRFLVTAPPDKYKSASILNTSNYILANYLIGSGDIGLLPPIDFAEESNAMVDRLLVPYPPLAPSATAGDARITLTWQSPPLTRGAPATSYRIHRGISPGGESFLVEVGDVLTYRDTLLTNGVTYFYQVSAVNAVGEGPRSNEASATPMTTPSGVPSLQATAGDARVVLAWQPPSSDGGSPVTNYKIYRGTSSGAETLLTTIENVLAYTDTGLTNGVTYYYQVSAVNAAGEGPWYNEVSATPSPAPTPDTTKPTVAITSPASGATIESTTVTIAGTASDDIAVQKVELSTDDTNWILASGTTSWSGTVTLSNGPNTIYARATDTSGNTMTASVAVTLEIPVTGAGGLPIAIVVAGLVVAAGVVVAGLAIWNRSRGRKGQS